MSGETVAQKGAGAGMLKDIPLMVEMTRQIVQAVKIPVTAKTRLGWDCEHIIIEDIAERLQDVGIQALAIHGRTVLRCIPEKPIGTDCPGKK